MQIRPATAEDFERVLVPARKFFDASGYGDVTTFDDDSFRITFSNLLSGGVCLVAETGEEIVGIAGAVAYPLFFNRSHITGQEMFWWLNPEHRGTTVGWRMFTGLEDWAREFGCKTFSMLALESLSPEEVGSMYRRAGYRKSENSYIKEL
jgi:GNAT superfamily N-acetyltransferase